MLKQCDEKYTFFIEFQLIDLSYIDIDPVVGEIFL